MARLAILFLLLASIAAVLAAAGPTEAKRSHDSLAKRMRADEDVARRAVNTTDVVARTTRKKSCVAWPNAVPAALAHVAPKNPFAMYTWSAWCPDASTRHGIPCIPMLNGWRGVSQFSALGHNLPYALAPNEPNQPGSYLSPGSAAELWRQHLTPIHNKGGKIITPGISNAQSGFSWLSEFFKECPDCRNQAHAIGVHWYGNNAANFISYMEQAHQKFNKTLWVTEFSCAEFGSGKQCNTDMAWALMKEAKEWLDKTWYVEMYCWFGMFTGSRAGVPSSSNLITGSGQLNGLGEYYFS